MASQRSWVFDGQLHHPALAAQLLQYRARALVASELLQRRSTWGAKTYGVARLAIADGLHSVKAVSTQKLLRNGAQCGRVYQRHIARQDEPT